MSLELAAVHLERSVVSWLDMYDEDYVSILEPDVGANDDCLCRSCHSALYLYLGHNEKAEGIVIAG